jgi:hypothetical protein
MKKPANFGWLNPNNFGWGPIKKILNLVKGVK